MLIRHYIIPRPALAKPIDYYDTDYALYLNVILYFQKYDIEPHWNDWFILGRF